MRSTILALCLTALFGAAFSGLQAQSSCSVKPTTVRPYGSGQAQMAAHKINFSNALKAGSVQYSEIQRLNLIEFMERVLQKTSYQTAQGQADSLHARLGAEADLRSPAENLARQREIIDSIKALSIVNAANIATAKEKLCLVDEFEAIMRKTFPEAH